ncbi:MAG: putative toxin-antitoxin system toxin component, PIN family [Saprospiraceae bacterium]|nr:putative toxin-antitoxin system toxin component, PIN family [Saprospiraceae bacterium]
MRVVLDTNVLLPALPRSSNTHLIFTKLLEGAYELCVSSDILLEYEEVFKRKANKEVAQLAMDVLEILPNLIKVQKFFYWHLITADHDDNKFVDCAIAGNADFIVSDDAHFNILASISFPKVTVISSRNFLELLPPAVRNW